MNLWYSCLSCWDVWGTANAGHATPPTAGRELLSVTGQPALVDHQPASIKLQVRSGVRNPTTQDLRLSLVEDKGNVFIPKGQLWSPPPSADE